MSALGGPPSEERVLLIAAHWRINPAQQQLPHCFGISENHPPTGSPTTAGRRRRSRNGSSSALAPVLIVDGTLVPTRDHSTAERTKTYGYSTNHQVVTDAGTRLLVAVGQPVLGDRNDYEASPGSEAKATVGRPTTTADGSYQGTGLPIPHHRPAR
ncbi:transposase [Kitasatospora sp. NPDC017646]|uniref:transposase n=1 Tax=Kitasatospora sp. NPDC017646 TaxID=3364024 RepID=UPI0037BB61BC